MLIPETKNDFADFIRPAEKRDMKDEGGIRA
jgi:hypothetical protein